jgi:hypothetical protein
MQPRRSVERRVCQHIRDQRHCHHCHLPDRRQDGAWASCDESAEKPPATAYAVGIRCFGMLIMWLTAVRSGSERTDVTSLFYQLKGSTVTASGLCEREWRPRWGRGSGPLQSWDRDYRGDEECEAVRSECGKFRRADSLLLWRGPADLFEKLQPALPCAKLQVASSWWHSW